MKVENEAIPLNKSDSETISFEDKNENPETQKLIKNENSSIYVII